MLCPSCGQENQADSRFCRSCGAALEAQCANCGRALLPDARFCDACGSPVQSDESQTISAEMVLAPAPPPLPGSFKDGRYGVKKFLGEGGAKKVYLAHDTLLDRDVAFALIKTDRLDETGRERVVREARTMARLDDHPNIVQIHDLGDEDGQPFMVLPVMGGGDVDDLLRNASEQRLDLDRALSIAMDVCRGLAFAHSQGVVHRDLKPGNVWLTADGAAKIGDFGLAVSPDHSRLTQDDMIVGTLWYMSPEQATGGQIDARTDLYSLGCMIYQIVTGRPPFMGDGAVAIIGQHANSPPVSPTWYNPKCPKPLEALTLRLLAKAPSDRPQSATEVLSALQDIDPFGSDEEAAPTSSSAHSLDRLAGGVFVGRQQEMAGLHLVLEQAMSGKGRMTMLVGEAGIGKSRTAQELATYAELRGAHVLFGRCYEEKGMPPYWPWVQALRSYIREEEPEQLLQQMGSAASDIAEIVPDVREVLPDLPTAPALESSEHSRFRLFDSITRFLNSASQARPLVIVLDNLHAADSPSLLLLEFLARELEGARLMIVGTYQDIDLSRTHPLSRTLGVLAEQLFDRVVLRGLRRQDVTRFIELVTGMSAPRPLVTAVHSQTEGNPLFMTEVVRLLVQEGELDPERLQRRKRWTVTVP